MDNLEFNSLPDVQIEINQDNSNQDITIEAGMIFTSTQEQGERGLKGDRGEKGEKGDPGEPGKPGEKGEMGERGPQGIQGERGERGPQGAQGIRGEKGERGDRGEKGERGDVGPQGPQGPAGPAGSSGSGSSYDNTQIQNRITSLENSKVAKNDLTVELAKKVDLTVFNNRMSQKADRTTTATDLSQKADKTFVISELNKKVNKTDLVIELNKKQNAGDYATRAEVDSKIKAVAPNPDRLEMGASPQGMMENGFGIVRSEDGAQKRINIYMGSATKKSFQGALGILSPPNWDSFDIGYGFKLYVKKIGVMVFWQLYEVGSTGNGLMREQAPETYRPSKEVFLNFTAVNSGNFNGGGYYRLKTDGGVERKGTAGHNEYSGSGVYLTQN